LSLLIPFWIQSIAEFLQQGLVLLIDYGFPAHEYYHLDRDCGTLMCHYQHHSHDNPLILPGIQDITAHVNFTQIAYAAKNSDLTVAGFTSQANFLMNCGLLNLIAETNIDKQIEVNKQIKMLTLPSEMGELFKVIALTKNITRPLMGFSYLDRRKSL
jgi:SAM-dependent MidA family methyltransferase